MPIGRKMLEEMGASAELLASAEPLMRRGQVRRAQAVGEDELRATVLCGAGEENVRVRLDADGGLRKFSCSCGKTQNAPCVHVAALCLYLTPTVRAELLARERGAFAQELSAYFSSAAPQPRSACLRAEIHIQPANGTEPARAALRVGGERMYVVRALHPFLEDYFSRKGTILLGKSAVIDPEEQCFPPADEKALRYLLDCARARALALGETRLREKTLPLEDGQLGALLELLRAREFFLMDRGRSRRVPGVTAEPPALRLCFRLDGGVVEMEAHLPQELRPLTKDGRFVLADGKLHRLDEAWARLLRPFFGRGGRSVCRFRRQEGEELLGELLAVCPEKEAVELDEALSAQVARGELVSRLRLDAGGGEILARVEFDYGGRTLDPFRRGPGEGGLLLRDHAGERRVLELLSAYGFLVRPGEAHLAGTAACCRFLEEGVPEMEKLAEVYATRALLNLKPRRVRPSGRLDRRGRSLWFYLEAEGVTAEDYEEIFRALRERKRYVRLKSGAFLTLAPEDGWAGVRTLVLESEEAAPEGLRFPEARAAYLPEVLKDMQIETQVEESVRTLLRGLQEPPEADCPIEGLRPYQRRGFRWLHFLAAQGLGGILADDMGLGKTVQALALFVRRKRDGETQPCLVVAPTSLLYNWLYEARRFAPELRAVVLSGQQQERREMCEDLEGVDVVVCSYAQLRRDADFLSEREWSCLILDEAQQIKNASTMAAAGARRLRAKARFALTGTPMENHLGELWSLLDCVLPGYLFGRQEFQRRFGEGQNAGQLAALLRPFLLRRVKKDVLQELPDKWEQTLACSLPPEQRRLYDAELARARDLMDGERNHRNIRVLASITRLRELCCHPKLCYEGYLGGSAKMELAVQLVLALREGGHRALLFSQFTSLLALLRERLEKEEVPYLYLDGDTPAKERAELCAAFNEGDAPLFLISLRAGGFGLNLTAADSVIHFDPWWNPAVEDQATDRAHRIGQKNKVHVYKLIAQDTIEEKVLALQEEKKALIDAVVRPGEALPAALTEEDLRRLFE